MSADLRKVTGLGLALCTLAVCGCSTLSPEPHGIFATHQSCCAEQTGSVEGESHIHPQAATCRNRAGHFMRDTGHEFAVEYIKNDEWPKPYVELSRRAFYEPLDIQAQNARVQLRTLWDYHFDSGNGELNSMGKKRLSDILEQAASMGRTVYVQRSLNRQETNTRIASVQNELQILGEEQGSFEVQESRATPSVLSGGEAQKTIKLLTEPQQGSTTGGGTSGASSSGYGSGR